MKCATTFVENLANQKIMLRFNRVADIYIVIIAKKSFKIKNCLIVHIRSHTGEKPFYAKKHSASYFHYQFMLKFAQVRSLTHVNIAIQNTPENGISEIDIN